MALRATRGRVVAVVAAGVVAAALGSPGAATAAPADQGQILGAGDADAVPGSYIVVLKQNSENVATVAERLAGRHDGTLRRTFARAVRGFSTTMTEADAKYLAAAPEVAYVQQNKRLHTMDTQTDAGWGLDRSDQASLPLDSSYTYPSTASGVHAYIIDTGIRTTHADFAGRATSGFDAVDGGTADDCNGHGTHVAGTVGGTTYGVAKEVRLVAVRVLDCDGSGTTEQVVAGIDWVAQNAVKPAVANMSLGGSVDTSIDDAVNGAIAAGVTMAVAAGNDNADACTGSPARVPEAITVGATADTDARASFSNLGTCLDIFAPGQNIASAWVDSDIATTTISGTSMATPHVAGAAALVLAADPTTTPAQVAAVLTSTATPDAVTVAGDGSPNRLLRIGG